MTLCVFSPHPQGFILPRRRLAPSPFGVPQTGACEAQNKVGGRRFCKFGFRNGAKQIRISDFGIRREWDFRFFEKTWNCCRGRRPSASRCRKIKNFIITDKDTSNLTYSILLCFLFCEAPFKRIQSKKLFGFFRRAFLNIFYLTTMFTSLPLT